MASFNHQECRHCGDRVWVDHLHGPVECVPCKKTGGKRCIHCGSTKCLNNCAPHAVFLERQRVVAFLRAKNDPKATALAKEIEDCNHHPSVF